MDVLGGLHALGNNLMPVVLTLKVLIDKPFGTNESGGQSKPILFLHSRTVQMAQRIGFNLSIPNTDYLKRMNCIRQPMKARRLK